MSEESLFLVALDLPTDADRDAFLARECGADTRLRARVEQLLAASAGASGILDTTPTVVGPVARVTESVLAAERTFADRYVLVRKLGAGGMGEVWAADQTVPVRRPVALKVIRPALSSPGVLARFDQERQALAVMDHPHIAKVFDAGVADGLPYLAMELIEGVPVTTHCAARRLTVRQRLELFATVCFAVQHAHQKGVVHRDLKPANVLIADVDGRPAPKVIDFGIAKAAGAKLTDRTLHTGYGAILGTLEYMAPEQAGSADVDTRADIYALGVILYELLTGTTPIRRSDHAGGGVLELLRAVREDDPPPPSRRSGTARGDLDWVVMKCLEKDRARRYDTAAGLARDVQRYLADEVVEARPPSAGYRARKFVRRNRPQVIAAAAVLIAGLVGGAVATWQAFRATAAEERALADRDAKERARQAEADARADARRQLWKAQLSRAAATTQSNLPGQRSASLAQLREALATAAEFDLTDEDRRGFRNVAVAALGLPELEVTREWDGYPSGSRHLTVDGRLDRYARSDPTGAVSVRSVADDRELHRLPGSGQPVRVALSDDGALLAVVEGTGTGHVYRLGGPVPERLLTARMDAERTPHFAASGGRLVFVSGNSIRAWDRESGRVQTWPLPGRPWGATALSADGRVFAVSCDRNRKMAVHVCPLDAAGAGFDLPLPGPAEGMSWHPGGKTLAVFADRRIRLWDVSSRREVVALDGHRTAGGQVAFDVTGDHLFSNDWSGLLRVWDWRARRQLLALPAGWSSYDRMASTGANLLVHGPTQPILRVVRCNPGRELRAIGQPDPDAPDVLVDPESRFLLVSGAGGTTAVDPETGDEWGRLGDSVRSFHLTPAGDLLTSGPHGPHWWPRTDDSAAGVTRFGPPEWVGPAHSGAAETHGASADGRVVAVPNHSAGAVVLHRTPGGIPAPTGPQDYVRTAAVSPDGRWVATGSHDSPSGVGAKVWDARTGAPVRALPVPGLCPVGFSPDGRWLVTAGGGVRLWRVGSWEEGAPVADAANAVGWAFAPGGETLAVGGHGMVRLVRPSDGTEVARLPLPGQGKFRPRCFAPDGGRLYVTDLETGGLFAWDLRLLRQGLTDLGLDWAAPPIPPAPPLQKQWRVEFVGTDRLKRTWDSMVKAAWAAPADIEVRTRLAALAKTPEGARLHASLALLLDSNRVDARYYRAQASLRLKQYEEAAADAAAVLRAVPGHLEATRIRDAAEIALRTPKSPPTPAP